MTKEEKDLLEACGPQEGLTDQQILLTSKIWDMANPIDPPKTMVEYAKNIFDAFELGKQY